MDLEAEDERWFKKPGYIVFSAHVFVLGTFSSLAVGCEWVGLTENVQGSVNISDTNAPVQLQIMSPQGICES
jgi:hypothetical protein